MEQRQSNIDNKSEKQFLNLFWFCSFSTNDILRLKVQAKTKQKGKKRKKVTWSRNRTTSCLLCFCFLTATRATARIFCFCWLCWLFRTSSASCNWSFWIRSPSRSSCPIEKRVSLDHTRNCISTYNKNKKRHVRIHATDNVIRACMFI